MRPGNLGIFQRLLLGVLILILGSVGSLGGYWIYLEYRDFKLESAELRRDFIETRNRAVKAEVDKAVSFIEFNKVNLEARLKDELRAKVDQAIQIVESLYLGNIAETPPARVEELCRQALRAIRFWGGRGYYFALDTKGVVQVNGAQPQLEGADLLGVVDTEGRPVNRNMIDLAQSRGRGYYEYTWAKPGHQGTGFRKVSAIRYCRALDWVIGLGEYWDDWSNAAQREVLRNLEEAVGHKDGRLFAGTFDGQALLGGGNSGSLPDAADVTGREVVGKLVAAARHGGDFVEYAMPARNGGHPLRRVCYSRGVPDWNWYVGAGYYLADLEESIASGQAQLDRKIRHKLINIVILVLVSCCLAVFIFALFSRRLARELGVFRSFFDRAATEMETIDTGSLATPELRSLAEAANRMVAERDRMNLEKEKMEEQLRQSQKMEAMGSLAGGIAHDFNNILAAIVGYTELAQHQARRGGDPLNELDQVLAASQRARDLVRQILTFSRKSLPELTALDLNREARYAAGILERTIPRMIRLELDLAPDLASVQGDRTQIEQVLMNLGSNAADAMPGGGRLLIRTDNVTLEPGHEGDLPPGAYARLRVSDDGPGMDQETLERIFDPFFTTKPPGRGTGLGLSTAYGIIASHGGSITCRSRPGAGATFTILLPALSGSGREAAPEPQVDQGRLDGDERVLVVDDDPAVRDVAVRFLTGHGYQALTAASGEEALDIYRKQGAAIDLVVLDLSMPGMGGHACLQRLLALDPEVRVLIASGYSPGGEIADTVKLGAASFITKPFGETELLGRVRRVLDA